MFVSATCRGVQCHYRGCDQPAVAKVGEEIAHDDPFKNRHNLTAYVCAEHFEALMGIRGIALTEKMRQSLAGPQSTEEDKETG